VKSEKMTSSHSSSEVGEVSKPSLTYDEFLAAVRVIAHMAEEWGVRSVYGIPRGGLVPAVYISHALDIPLGRWEKCLVVDDIADSGATLKREARGAFKTATIYYCEDSEFMPDLWLLKKVKDWVIFPWEVL